MLLEVELDRRSADNDVYKYTILAIEEPEAHLHPQLQRLVFRDFLRSDVPILLSTHSPNIVSVAEPDWFVLLKQHAEGTKVASTAELTKLPKFLKQDLSRYLDATRGEVVFGKGIILVEGIAEGFLVPQFSSKMKDAGLIPYTLDGAGISICNVAGTDFIPYVYFFGKYGLDLPLVIITDGDKYVGVDRLAKRVLKNKSLDKGFKTRLKEALTKKDFDAVRQLLEEQGEGCFEGLNRGIKIAKYIDRAKSEQLRQLYDEQKWDSVRDELGLLGIFVNDWTLEAELIDVGYQEEYVEVYGELGASKTKQRNMEKALADQQVENILSRIEESGMGKGRFAQRMANKIDADRIPKYIQDAMAFIVLRTPPKSSITRWLSLEDGSSSNDEEE